MHPECLCNHALRGRKICVLTSIRSCGFRGAGTGGLTRQIVPMLQASLHQSPLLKYIATDVTAGFGPNLKAAIQLPQFDFKVISPMPFPAFFTPRKAHAVCKNLVCGFAGVGHQ